MTPEERQTAGPALNALKDEINSALMPKNPRLVMRLLMHACPANGSM